jgi:hypothetical protein
LVLVHLLLKVFLVLFTLITVGLLVHRVEGASLRAVLLLRDDDDDGQHVGRNAFGL